MQTTIALTGLSYQEKMDSIIKLLESGIKDVFTSGRYQEYLTVMSRFHQYSFRNTILIMTQRPNATQVAGLHTWNNVFKRSVIKGETGIRILAPYSVKKEIWSDQRDARGQLIADPSTGELIPELKEIQIQSFRIVSVFDVNQTTGKPLPELAMELKSNLVNSAALEKAIRAIADCPIEYAAISGRTKGYYDLIEHKIVIRERMATSQSIKTMIHELAHSRLHRLDNLSDQAKDRATREVEAESIAYVVLQHLGIDTSDYSFGYLASWSKSQELKELSSSLSLIQKESDELIRLIIEQLSFHT